MNLKKIHFILALALFFLVKNNVLAETGYRLWLRYDKIENQSALDAYRLQLNSISFNGTSSTALAAKTELITGIESMLGKKMRLAETSAGTIICGTRKSSPLLSKLIPAKDLLNIGDGFIIRTITTNGKKNIIISSESDAGVLYGVFHFLKLIKTNQSITTLAIREVPAIKHRVLNHWDNLDGTVERGYAGSSLWNWHKLPGFTETRYIDYARANASVGINGTVLNNVNTNSLSLTKEYIAKAAALANVFRPYGIKVYLSARFSSPIEIGGLKTADPLDPAVKKWWNDKAAEIYESIPDFGGFLVKANSEGQPGPQNYGRTHADGANMLAAAVQPFNGIVMWRAFVYDNKVPDDRAKQAFSEFKPLDGKFEKNVLVQVKNGAIDFQPREPFHPLFGAMPATPLMMEFQITQEYLGFSTHLVYLATMFEETLKSDTYAKGKGSTVSNIISGKADGHSLTGIAGVANIGSDVNWTGHPFGQANWYSFGRLAWNPDASASAIADEWIKLTFTNKEASVQSIKKIMMDSREAAVNYMTPLGLHHIMARNHHYGPGPWVKDAGREDWTSVYYHKADSFGVGFNRTATGSNALSQYFPEVAKAYGNRSSVPEKYLLWFHRVRWDEKMPSGKTLWNELVDHYYTGVTSVATMQTEWSKLKGIVDNDRFKEVSELLSVQHNEAKWWRDACLLYFQSFSKMPLPAGYEKPAYTLDYYKNLKFHFVPGIQPD